MSYYYLMASVPMLSMEKPPELSLTGFRRMCADHLSSRDLDTLQAVLERDGEGSPDDFVTQWRNNETALRNAIAETRADRLGIDPGPHLRPETESCVYTATSTIAALSRPNPLERELEIDRIRWRILDDLTGHDPFSLSAVLAYALKLRMVERWSSADPDRGGQKVESLLNGIITEGVRA